MDSSALYKLTYGMFLLTTEDKGKHNGCIINTCIQVAENPVRIAFSVQKNNLTHDMIMNSAKINVSALTTEADFELFKHFGMQSGRDVDKFAGYDGIAQSANGLYYLTAANMYLSADVLFGSDLGTHTLFIAKVTDAQVLSEAEPCTYAYYHKSVKPAPVASAKGKWVCNVCGYVYEGDELPDDYICPLCKHGKEDFTYVPATESKNVKRYVCPVCGYVHEGDNPPEICPWCNIPGKDFVLQNKN